MPAIDIFFIASLVGTIAFTLSGFIAGVRHHLDLMGIFIVAFLTGNGGGIIRDTMLGKVPFILQDTTAIVPIVLTFIVGLILHRVNYMDIERRRVFVLSDSIGLVAFSLTGAMAAMDAGLGLFGVCVISFITATGGGIVRDLVVNEVPAILKSDFYGSVAIVVACAVYALDHFGYSSDITISAVFVCALLLRLLAHYRGWHLPRLSL